MNQVKIEAYGWCKEQWFAIDLKGQVCHTCFLQDKQNQSLFLMSADNNIDLGELLACLPELTQVKKMIIAWSYVQIIVYCYHDYQYYYIGHCISFMQNIVKIVDMLPNLPSELDIIMLQPLDQVM